MDSRLIFDSHWLFLVLSVFIFLSVWLLYAGVENNTFSSMDRAILSWFHSIRSKSLDTFFKSITWLGSLWILLPIYMINDILFYKENPFLQKYISLVFFGTIITTYMIKYSLDRNRPHLYGVIGNLPLDPSFPSAHSAQIAAFSIGILFSAHHHTPLFIALCLGLGLIALSVFASRLYLQVHYPTDVIGGILIALGWGIVSFWILGGINEK